LIQFDSVSKTYRSFVPPRTTDALRDFTAEIQRGEVFGIAGPNGAGKTTMLGLVLGFLRPTEGNLRIDGHAPREYVERYGVVYVPEIISIPTWWNVRGALNRYSVLAGVRSADRRQRVDTVIAKLGLEEQRGKRIKQLSKGNVQRVGIAQALLSEADLIVFDEPTHGLDPVWTQRFRTMVDELRTEDRAILIASHNLDELERLADRVAILDHGRLSRTADAHHQPTGEFAEYQLVLMEDHPAVASAFPGAERIGHRKDVAYHIVGTIPDLNAALQKAITEGARVRAFFPARSRLEAAFREAVGEE